ncbi:MAG: RhuM family protein [Patescibacteria group bacterium]
MEEKNKIIIYKTDSGQTRLEVKLVNETVWLSQKQMAELFDCSTDNISLHLKKIFKEDELKENSVTEDYSVTASDGKKYLIKHYNLDAIISVGYRINSKAGTKFRQWATKTLRHHIVDGFTINKKRLAKNYDAFLSAVENVKKLLPAGGQIKPEDALELIKMFAPTMTGLILR